MEQYLVDTNSISDYLSESLSRKGVRFMDSVIDAIPNISIISQIELLCWSTDKMIEQKVKDFISDSLVLNISAEVIDCCVKIRKGKKVKTSDAIIAATALSHGYTLITRNEKDFFGIKDLKIMNPHKL